MHLCICYLLFCDALSHNCQLRFRSMNMYAKISAGISYIVYMIFLKYYQQQSLWKLLQNYFLMNDDSDRYGNWYWWNHSTMPFFFFFFLVFAGKLVKMKVWLLVWSNRCWELEITLVEIRLYLESGLVCLCKSFPFTVIFSSFCATNSN